MSLVNLLHSNFKKPVLAVGLSLMLMAWLADAWLDSVFTKTPLLDGIIHPDLHEIAIRLLFIGIQILFLAYISRCQERDRKREERLAVALLDAEQERSRSEAFMDAVGDAISIQDLQMKILYQNRAHKELMGEHVGEYCYRAYQGRGEICEGCHLQLSFTDGASHCRELFSSTALGGRHVEILSTPLRDASGKIVAGIEAVRDTTERKEVELQVVNLNHELERRAEKLEEANRELEAFSYSLSHDLRSYITRISTAHQVLETAFHGLPEASFAVDAIGTACEAMDEMIEAMLTLAQVSRKGMHLEVVDLSEVARELALHLQQQELEREVEFLFHPGIQVTGDRYLLKLALRNLLENAWKYTRGVPEPRIEFGAADRDGKRFVFVRDNGIGFAMAESEKLFAPFQRLQNAKGFPGNGIGLATVERVALRHGGEVRGEGEPGSGAVIYLHIPDLPEGERQP